MSEREGAIHENMTLGILMKHFPKRILIFKVKKNL